MRTVWPRLTTGLAAGLVAAGLLLSGCGGDSPEPKPLPKDSKSSPFRIAECHSPGDAGRGEEEDQGWGDCLRAALRAVRSTTRAAREIRAHPAPDLHVQLVHALRGNRRRHRQDLRRRRIASRAELGSRRQLTVPHDRRRRRSPGRDAVDYDAQTVDRSARSAKPKKYPGSKRSNLQLRSQRRVDGGANGPVGA